MRTRVQFEDTFVNNLPTGRENALFGSHSDFGLGRFGDNPLGVLFYNTPLYTYMVTLDVRSNELSEKIGDITLRNLRNLYEREARAAIAEVFKKNDDIDLESALALTKKLEHMLAFHIQLLKVCRKIIGFDDSVSESEMQQIQTLPKEEVENKLKKRLVYLVQLMDIVIEPYMRKTRKDITQIPDDLTYYHEHPGNLEEKEIKVQGENQVVDYFNIRFNNLIIEHDKKFGLSIEQNSIEAKLNRYRISMFKKALSEIEKMVNLASVNKNNIILLIKQSHNILTQVNNIDSLILNIFHILKNQNLQNIGNHIITYKIVKELPFKLCNAYDGFMHEPYAVGEKLMADLNGVRIMLMD